ncbi:MAG: transglutaminase-like cysteine peptidase [Rhizobiales bacterium]|nr:transglutaminase-like cysteine peptidase [Hyphomicrobiales bacterium]
MAGDSALFVSEHGKSRPPIGFVKFCAQSPAKCKAQGTLLTPHLRMDAERWADLFEVNLTVNKNIKPASDQELYGEVEFWAYPATAGDCEDYVLLKQRELEKRGFPSSSLLITVVLDENNEGHAVLTVTSDAGDYVLDNRRDDILLWSETKYRFLKRQTQRDPKQWVSLDNAKTTATASIGTGN